MTRLIRDWLFSPAQEHQAKLVALLAIVLSVGVTACSSDSDEPQGDAGEREASADEMDSGAVDNKSDSGIDSAGIQIATDATIERNRDADQPGFCTSDKNCDDGIFCNGKELCLADDTEDDAGAIKRCYRAISGPCVDPRQCTEDPPSCDCNLDGDGEIAFICGGTDCDDDGDGVDCEQCGGKDCDDGDSTRFRGNIEVCDEMGKDEDCEWKTYRYEGKRENTKIVGAEGDKDGDGHIDEKCYNINPETGTRHGGDDCDDSRADINRDASEICDGEDNNCNELTDEDENGKEFGMQIAYCTDHDGDKWGNKKEIKLSCHKPDGFIEYDKNADDDCNDDDDEVHPGNYEICDLKDNDCDRETDEPEKEGNPLIDQPTFTDTDVVCNDKGEWEIVRCPENKLDCDESVLSGCETFADRLGTCRDCKTNCLFSCGELGCDEVTKISVGAYHACAVTAEQRAACWGRNPDGRLGDDSTAASSIPTQVVGISNVEAISAGSAHTCAAIGENRELYCWGSNSHGQLGSYDSIDESLAPVRTAGVMTATLSHIESIATGKEHTCAVDNNGAVVCWGNQANGRLGNGSDSDDSVLTPWPALDPYWGEIQDGKEIVAGDAHTCMITQTNTVQCWGDNTFGQLGDDKAVTESVVAQEVQGLIDVTQLAAGPYHTCALSQGHVYCWGLNSLEELGRSHDEDDDIPLPVPDLSDIISITAGEDFTCALTSDRNLLCWGSNAYGERGDDDPSPSALPTMVNIGPVLEVDVGRSACALTTEGRVSCWGNNLFGQLGNSKTSTDAEPLPQMIRPLRESTP
ncbi:MAG: hypothetical protein JXA30_03590 [Deltaproteobacteria bacterium]|nr:hypothetical protein [Deltaproteobacteria bacterium]